MDNLECLKFIHHETDRKCHISIFKRWITNFNPEPEYEVCDQVLDDESFFRQAYYEMLDDSEDCYFSINSFRHHRRISDDVWHLNAIALDFDFYKIKKYEKYDAESFYQKFLKNKLKFKPNLVIDSGRGLYIIYCFKHAPRAMSKSYHWLYQCFYDEFKGYGLDAKAMNITQLIRIPGTINSKTKKKVEILDTFLERYEFKTFLDYFNKLKKGNKRIKSSSVNKFSFDKKYRDNFVRKLINDFKILIQLRNDTQEISGYREQLIFLARRRMKWAKFSEDKEIKLALELNSLFKKPLTTKEVIKTCKPYGKLRANSIDSIIKKLAITKEEQAHLKLLVNNNERIKRYQKRKQRHPLTNKTAKQLQIYQRRLKVCALKNKGYRNKVIAEKLKVSRSLITSDLRYINTHKFAFIKKRIFKKFNVDHFKIRRVNFILIKIIKKLLE